MLRDEETREGRYPAAQVLELPSTGHVDLRPLGGRLIEIDVRFGSMANVEADRQLCDCS